MTSPLVQRRLKEFVDRDSELGAFVTMLDRDDTAIMCVWGESGIGKTSLLMRMVHECGNRQLRKAELVWKDTSPHDYLGIMRSIRDNLGPNDFGAFTDLVNFYHQAGYQPQLHVTLAVQGGAVTVGQNTVISDHSSVGTMAGVMIKDSMIQLPRMDLEVSEAERRSRLTGAFLAELRATLEKEPAVIFFDAVEKMASDTERWVWNELLDAARNGLLAGGKFVLCGHNPPPTDRDWTDFITDAGLQPLVQADIEAYLRKRVPNLAEPSLIDLATMILALTKGNPSTVASSVDAFLRIKK